MATTKEDILKAIEEMSVMELVELISDIEEKFGVTAAAAVAAHQQQQVAVKLMQLKKKTNLMLC